jgi:hypothetical protein
MILSRKKFKMVFREKWESFTLHAWLLFSSYGIIFAILSFVEDLGATFNQPWVKGTLAILLGFLFYLFIGLPHLYGAKRHTTIPCKVSMV